MSKEYFSHDIGTLNNLKIVKMMNEYGFLGLGYYWAIVEEIYRTDGEFDMADICVMSKNTGIDENELTTFIDKCVKDFTEKGEGLFIIADNLLTSASIKKRIALRNKRAAAGAAKNDEEFMKLADAKNVNLTEEDYNKFCDKLGEDVVNKAIDILDGWLERNTPNAKKYTGKNHKGFFRIDCWVVTEAKKALGKTGTNWSI